MKAKIKRKHSKGKINRGDSCRKVQEILTFVTTWGLQPTRVLIPLHACKFGALFLTIMCHTRLVFSLISLSLSQIFSPSKQSKYINSLVNIYADKDWADLVARMDLINSFMNWVGPPASMVMLACAWPALCLLNACQRLYSTMYPENMDDKVVIITGASSGIGEVSHFSVFLFLSLLFFFLLFLLMVFIIFLINLNGVYY